MASNISGGVAHQLPSDLREALMRDKKAYALWESLTPLARNEWICWTIAPKLSKTRNEHIARVISELKDGMRRPCCWIGCIHRKDKKISPSVQFILKKRSNTKK
ncbi:MAG: YdeI/OmpD-associated family protein [Patescibacteria group bacterium]